MPRIAVTPCNEPQDYDAAVRQAGGEPWVPAIGMDDPADAIRQVDGLLLTGGDDVDPAFFGEPPHPTYEPAEPGRDAFELALVREALAADLPVFAICRGLQVLNVAAGGTLIQDIPSEPGRFEAAQPGTCRRASAHEVAVAAGSRLAGCWDRAPPGGRCRVNSRHHQAIRAPGRGPRRDGDRARRHRRGVESPAHRFCVGVQWHPESFHRTGEFDELFRGFVEACRARP